MFEQVSTVRFTAVSLSGVQACLFSAREPDCLQAENVPEAHSSPVSPLLVTLPSVFLHYICIDVYPDVWKYNQIILYFNKGPVLHLQFTVGHLQLLLSQYAQLDLPEMY